MIIFKEHELLEILRTRISQITLGITLVIYGISGIITSFFVQGFVYIVKAAIFYLRQNGQVEELEEDDDFYSEE